MSCGPNHTCKIVQSIDLRVTLERFPSKQATYPLAHSKARAGFLRDLTANKRRECGIVRGVSA